MLRLLLIDVVADGNKLVCLMRVLCYYRGSAPWFENADRCVVCGAIWFVLR